MRRIFILGIGLGSSLALLIVAAQAVGYMLHGDVLAYSSNRTGDWEVYLMDVALGTAINVTHNPADDHAPAWSADGRLAFVTNCDDNREIYVFEINAIRATNASSSPTTNETSPAWLMDGRLSFVSDRDGDDDVYVLEASNGQWLNMTNDSVPSRDPNWSPHGQLAFASNRSGPWRIHIISTPDSPGQNLSGYLEERQFTPAWSPDNLWLVFQSVYVQQADIYLRSTVTGRIERLTDDSARDGDPAWSPDGQRLAFSSNHEGNDEIYVMELATRAVRRLTFSAAIDGQPVWLP